MRLLSSSVLVLLAGSAAAFAPAPICRQHVAVAQSPALFMSEAATAETNMADSGKPPVSADSDTHVADAEIPTKLPSDVGMDYVPLATMLATGQLAEADQVRDAGKEKKAYHKKKREGERALPIGESLSK